VRSDDPGTFDTVFALECVHCGRKWFRSNQDNVLCKCGKKADRIGVHLTVGATGSRGRTGIDHTDLKGGNEHQHDRPQFPVTPFSKTERRVVQACWELADWSRSPAEAKTSDVVRQVWGDEEKESTALRPMLTAINNRCLKEQPPTRLALRKRGDFIEIDYAAK